MCIRELLGYRELLGFRKLTNLYVDLSCTSYMRGVFILCWHHEDNRLRSIYKILKVKTASLGLSKTNTTNNQQALHTKRC